MAKSIYEEVTNDLGMVSIKRTDTDGTIWWIPTDPANSDYQAYLNKDKPQVEHLTEIPTPDEA
jgi:hypothetical protein